MEIILFWAALLIPYGAYPFFLIEAEHKKENVMASIATGLYVLSGLYLYLMAIPIVIFGLKSIYNYSEWLVYSIITAGYFVFAYWAQVIKRGNI